MAVALTVSSEEELPENIKDFYELLSKRDQIVDCEVLKDSYLYVKSEMGTVGLFPKSVQAYKDRVWFLPLQNSPLFIKGNNELVVIAPCDVPNILLEA